MLDWAHIHIAVNHFPIILAVIGTAAAVLATFSPRRGTWMYAATSLTLAGLLVIPTYFTGEPAEKFLNRPWYITRGSIHDHEEAALISALLIGVVALLAAFAWRRMVRYPRETSLPGSLRTALLVGSLAATGHICYTALLGGRIVHDSTILQGPRPAGVPEQPMRGAPARGIIPGDSIVAAPPISGALAPAPAQMPAPAPTQAPASRTP
ncbi:MAG: hypothetical protein ABIP93_21345 [Gemmatimonadaceae bacterium]